MLAPSQPSINPASVSFLPTKSPAPATSQGQPSPDGAMPPVEGSPEQAGGEQNIVKNLQEHLDQVPEDQKQFLAEHLTPEFVRAIGIINGPEVARYLSQFADPNKVLVPVPREIAEQYLAQQKQGQSAQPQGQPPQGQMPQQAPAPQPPVAQAPVGPPQGMMAPH